MVIERPWSRLEKCESGCISNFDFTADEGVEDELRTGKCWSEYTAYDFYGYVWFKDNRFKCNVWRYGMSREVIEGETILEMMHAVSRNYGYE